MDKKTKKRNKSLLLIKCLIILTLGMFFAAFLFLLLLPKKSDIIKGITYDLKYPEISHYSQIPYEVFENDFKLMKETGIKLK